MPSSSEKQRRFFGAVMAAKKGKGGVGGEARRAAKQMSKQQIKDFLKKKGAAYEAGFLQKCAEAGVDPEQLVKKAARFDQLLRYLARSGMTLPADASAELARTVGRGSAQARQLGNLLRGNRSFEEYLGLPHGAAAAAAGQLKATRDRKSTRLNSSHTT